MRWYLVCSLTEGASAVLSWENHSMRDLMADMAMKDGLSRDRMTAAKGVFADSRATAVLYMGSQNGWRSKTKCRS